jgi:hypothetical protein
LPAAGFFAAMTAPNTIVEPIHPKAMPVILTAAKSMMCGCGRRGTRRKRYSDRYRTTT